MRATLALIIDAYRELNARKLFWITMAISMLIVLVYAAAGINEQGLTFLHWSLPGPSFLNSKLIPPSLFYKFVFAKLGIPYWLTWGAMILALVSTASIIPDFVLGGAVELTLSKPISRVRLFLTKYLCGLIFSGLQVAAFSTACFLVIGIRGQSWQPSVFLAIPIVLAVFSYVYCISALVGMLTRSTIASVLIAVLFWFVVFLTNTADTITLQITKQLDQRTKMLSSQVERGEKQARDALIKVREAEAQSAAKPGEAPTPVAEPTEAELDAANVLLAQRRTSLKESQASLQKAEWYSRLFVYIKAPLPKTSETTGLLDRYLITNEDLGVLRRFSDANETQGAVEIDEAPPEDPRKMTPEQRRARRDAERRSEAAVEDTLRSRSLWWVLGTSFAFEAAVLGVACLIFRRRDF